MAVAWVAAAVRTLRRSGRRGTKEEAASLSRVSLPPCPCFWRLCADEKGGNLAGAGTTLAGFYIQCAEGWQGMWHAARQLDTRTGGAAPAETQAQEARAAALATADPSGDSLASAARGLGLGLGLWWCAVACGGGVLGGGVRVVHIQTRRRLLAEAHTQHTCAGACWFLSR